MLEPALLLRTHLARSRRSARQDGRFATQDDLLEITDAVLDRREELERLDRFAQRRNLSDGDHGVVLESG